MMFKRKSLLILLCFFVVLPIFAKWEARYEDSDNPITPNYVYLTNKGKGQFTIDGKTSRGQVWVDVVLSDYKMWYGYFIESVSLSFSKSSFLDLRQSDEKLVLVNENEFSEAKPYITISSKALTDDIGATGIIEAKDSVKLGENSEALLLSLYEGFDVTGNLLVNGNSYDFTILAEDFKQKSYLHYSFEEWYSREYTSIKGKQEARVHARKQDASNGALLNCWVTGLLSDTTVSGMEVSVCSAFSVYNIPIENLSVTFDNRSTEYELGVKYSSSMNSVAVEPDDLARIISQINLAKTMTLSVGTAQGTFNFDFSQCVC